MGGARGADILPSEATTSFSLNPSPRSTILIHRLLVWIGTPNLRLAFPFASSN
jgi:hypothetical protein